MNIQNRSFEIITGRYEKGTPEQQHAVNLIFGEAHSAERFELYFHWYNIIHELGHCIISLYSQARLHPVNEEQLVNDFAVAYWSYYGETKKLSALSEAIAYALSQFIVPAAENVSHIEYALSEWGKESFYNFNDYGWFQMSCVQNALKNPRDLGEVLAEIGVKFGFDSADKPPKKTYSYVLNGENAGEIIQDAVDVLRGWSVDLPPVKVSFSDDPNAHSAIDYKYEPATAETLTARWDKNIADNAGDERWVGWKEATISDNESGLCKTFVILRNGEAIGEGTLIFSPKSGAISGRTELSDGAKVANINALRVDKPYEGMGHISRLVKVMERHAKDMGYETATIGVEAAETRNLAIYFHLGFDTFVESAVEDGALVLYYSKKLK